ncbi:MAG: ABC transporter permease [Methylotenera sp.]|nr:ABC transporter permease [Oligoflexia bacterium]
MKRFLALVSVRSKEFYRDRGTLVWTFVFPLIVLLGFAYGYSGRDEPVLRVGVYPSQTARLQPLHDFFAIPQIQFVNYDDEKAALKRVERHQLDLLLKSDETGTVPSKVIYWINPQSSKASLAERLLKSGAPATLQFEKQELTGKKLRYADWLVPGLLSMNLMFSCLFGVGYVIVRYRKNGVLKRMRATPLSAFEFLAAQVVSRMLLLLITTSLTLGGAVLLIGFPIQGSVLDLMIFVSVGSTALISLGLLVAARISSEEVADGVLNVMTWPMIFLSGIWFSLDGASPWVLRISQALPLTHIVDGVRAILIDGAKLSSLLPQMIALSVASIVLLTIGSLIFKWR